jgi:penicillin-binding protein 2
MNDTYLKTVDDRWYRQRLSGALICVFAVFLILLARLCYLQIIKGSDYRRMSENNCVRLRNIAPFRGLVFDRNGVLLVDNRPSFDVSIVLEDAKNPTDIVTNLAKLLDVGPETLLPILEKTTGWPSFKPLLLKRDLDRDAVAVVEAHRLDLPGIVISVEPMRHYIEGELASHLIGYLGEISEKQLASGRFPNNRGGDFIGKFGVERAYESFFHGEPGTKRVQVNALGQVTDVLETKEAVSGKNVYLTLDVKLQSKTEEMFADKVGAAVAIEPSSGHVLAIVSGPAFNPNAFVEGMTFDAWNRLSTNEFRPMENKAVQGQYPPGSTYKIVTAIAGLEEGVINENTAFYCPGHYRYGNRIYRCWKRSGHGAVKIIDALAQSCDVFFFRVGEELGVDRLARYAEGCGLGMTTGIKLDNEAPGLVPNSVWKLKSKGMPWQGGETLSVAIGQGFDLVTPLQMACLVAAVANGGTRYKPLIVQTIEAPDGSVVRIGEPEVLGKLPASKKTLQILKRGMTNAVNTPSGTGWNTRISGVRVAGKTGTVQVVAMSPDHEEDSHESKPLRFRDHAWFVAFAPAEEPRIAVAVLVEHGGHGASGAGPIASEMIRTYLGKPL